MLLCVTCASLQDPMFEGRWESLGRRMAVDETPLLAINRQLKASVMHPTYVVMFKIEMFGFIASWQTLKVDDDQDHSYEFEH